MSTDIPEDMSADIPKDIPEDMIADISEDNLLIISDMCRASWRLPLFVPRHVPCPRKDKKDSDTD